jgi:acyl carrier protein
MDRYEVVRELKAHVVREILEGDEAGLEEESPLLEWGVLNSLEIIRLLRFMRERFGVRLEPKVVTPDTFKDIGSMADLIVKTVSSGVSHANE